MQNGYWYTSGTLRSTVRSSISSWDSTIAAEHFQQIRPGIEPFCMSSTLCSYLRIQVREYLQISRRTRRRRLQRAGKGWTAADLCRSALRWTGLWRSRPERARDAPQNRRTPGCGGHADRA